MHNGRLLQRAVDEELSPLGLHHGQGRMLQAISRVGEITQADLARRMDVRPATITNMLKPLEEKKLIRRAVDPATNRARVVSLTVKGARVSLEVQAAWDRVENRLANDFTKTELTEVFQGLEKVRSALGGKGPDGEMQ